MIRKQKLTKKKTKDDKIQELIDEAEVFDEHDLNQILVIQNLIPEDNTQNKINQYEDGFKIASRNCQEQSYDMCLTDNFNFIQLIRLKKNKYYLISMSKEDKNMKIGLNVEYLCNGIYYDKIIEHKLSEEEIINNYKKKNV